MITDTLKCKLFGHDWQFETVALHREKYCARCNNTKRGKFAPWYRHHLNAVAYEKGAASHSMNIEYRSNFEPLLKRELADFMVEANQRDTE